MSEGAFDQNLGVRTQQLLADYLKLVERFNATTETGLSVDELDRRKAEVQKARDDLEWFQRQTREYFYIFHRLEHVDTQELKDALRRYRKYIEELPGEFTDPVFVEHREDYFYLDDSGRPKNAYRGIEPPVVQQRHFLERAIEEMESALASRGEGLMQVNAVAAQIQQRILLEARLLQQCEEDVQHYPDQEEIIRRSYRKAIDALREQS